MARAVKRDDADLAERILDVAEALCGRHGLEGVSLRQISAAAGTANNYAVQYYYGDVHGLITAVLAKRVPQVEAMRVALLSEIKTRRQVTTRALIDVLYRPLIDCVDASGERAYARFVLALLSSPAGERYAAQTFHLMSASAQVLDLLCEKHPTIPPALLVERQRLLASMVLTSLFNRRAPYNSPKCDAALIDNVLDMAAAALAAPVSEPVQALMQKARRLKGAK